jgi:dolichol-phosphate mannosyltransferase
MTKILEDVMPEKKVLIIIPTYNERENIPLIIPEIKKVVPYAEILIVDDNSPDGTSQIAKELSKSISGINILDRTEKEGLGKAYIAGFKWALEKDYDLILEMDADFSHNPEYLPDLIKAADEADLVIGSRYLNGTVNVVNWPLERLLLSYFGNIAARKIAGIKIMDCTGGFKCFRAETLRSLDLDSIASSGYSFQVEMNFYVQKANLKIKEVPIVFKDRILGESKMSSSIVKEAISLLWKLRFKSLFKK